MPENGILCVIEEINHEERNDLYSVGLEAEERGTAGAAYLSEHDF